MGSSCWPAAATATGDDSHPFGVIAHIEVIGAPGDGESVDDEEKGVDRVLRLPVTVIAVVFLLPPDQTGIVPASRDRNAAATKTGLPPCPATFVCL